jgi:hypothetical protein
VLGGDLAMSHLIEAVYQRVAYVGGLFRIRQVADCRDGVVQALQRVGRDPDDLHMVETAALNVPAGQRDAASIVGLSARSRPTGVFCASDPPALGLLQEMTEHRIRVPDDVAIIGYDDIEFAAAVAVLDPPPPPGAGPHDRAAARERVSRRRHAPAPPVDLRAGAGGPAVHQGRPRLMQRLPRPPSAAEAAG